jgi:hypothetical protein
MRCFAALNILYLESYIGETVSSLVRLQELRFVKGRIVAGRIVAGRIVAGRIVAVHFDVESFVGNQLNCSGRKYFCSEASQRLSQHERHYFRAAQKDYLLQKNLFPSGEVIDEYTSFREPCRKEI